MSAILNISIDAGSTFSNEITINDENDVVIDLTGYVVEGQIRKSFRSLNPVANFVMDIIDPINGKIRMNLTSESTENIKPGRYTYDIFINSPGVSDQVFSAKVTNGGTLYTTATVAFSAGGGTGATGNVTIVSGVVTGISITAPGSGYISDPNLVISGDGTLATGVAIRGNITTKVVEGILTINPSITR